MDIRVAAWLPVTAPIPVDRLRDAYAWAMQNRTSQYPLSAVELVDAWKHLVGRAETEGSSALRDDRLLPENAAGACGRCYKKKDPAGRILECLEISGVDGSLMGPCDHRPLTKEEKAEAAKKRVDFLAQLQAESRRVSEAKRKAEADKPKVVKPAGFELACSGCRRVVNTLAGWTEGERCGIDLKSESAMCPKCQTAAGVLSLGKMVCRECFHTYDVIVCAGRMSPLSQ